MINKELIGKIIQKSRQNKRMTQEQLAEYAGLSPNYLSKVERGLCMPSADIFLKIIECLDIPLKDFQIYTELDEERKQIEHLISNTNRDNLRIIIPVVREIIQATNKG